MVSLAALAAVRRSSSTSVHSANSVDCAAIAAPMPWTVRPPQPPEAPHTPPPRPPAPQRTPLPRPPAPLWTPHAPPRTPPRRPHPPPSPHPHPASASRIATTARPIR
ncbi:hypothetical protein GQ55_5G345200 [Panicum hallii var. hallii]|uniref:Uncharacterized protein n=1 Tax=Panicum hallii var. hallii TaxID=1504633 RepID=A0A2T7DM56_9POAL|nr:hypothetical protein GQ55_5G345200 [Panicum hallii var. hallii]